MARLNPNNSELINYDQQNSNSHNYSSFLTSSSPDSFPALMENGIIVKYDSLDFSNNIIEEKNEIDPLSPKFS